MTETRERRWHRRRAGWYDDDCGRSIVAWYPGQWHVHNGYCWWPGHSRTLREAKARVTTRREATSHD